MNVGELDERQAAAFKAFADTPDGAWMMEALIVGNYVLDPIPVSVVEAVGDAFSRRPLSEFERGICEGRRQLVIEIMDALKVGTQGAYEVINRVDRMAREDAGDSFASE